MKAQIYELERDIDNPFKDGRSRDWNKRPTIMAGSRFIVTQWKATAKGSSCTPAVEYFDGSLILSSTPDRQAKPYGHEPRPGKLAKAIMANAKEVEPVTVREMCAANDCDWGANEILRILVKLGKVTSADLAEVAVVPEDF